MSTERKKDATAKKKKSDGSDFDRKKSSKTPDSLDCLRTITLCVKNSAGLHAINYLFGN